MKSTLLSAGIVQAGGSATAQYTIIPTSIHASQPFDGFVSYSIEFSSFPDYAGNQSHPNTFSNNLLSNIGALIGTKPYIRVGGNTQDYALYNASLPFALNGTVDPKRSPDYPTTIHIGPSYFESYSTWPDVKFSHGFNLGLGGNTSHPEGWQTLLDTVPLACKALGGGKWYAWEYGNEPDLFSTSAQGAVRPPSWNEKEYVQQWLNGTRKIRELLKVHCPGMVSNGQDEFLGLSFAGTSNHLRANTTFVDGINVDKDIKLFSTHNYISGATSPGVTLQGTLMNHTTTMRSVQNHVAEYARILAVDPSAPPHIMGETNSLYNQGKPGLSNSFGAALWGVDFHLYCASVGIRRVHMHMGTNYRYQSWQPVTTELDSIGTKAPYYGNIAVAAFLGDIPKSPVSVAPIPLNETTEAAYAAYTSTKDSTSANTLARVMILNMQSYNSTVDGQGLSPLPASQVTPRGSKNFAFALDATLAGRKGQVRRLWANGSDAITGITWDGWSYNYELDEGRPVRLRNVTVGETTVVGKDGSVSVNVPDSSAVILDFGKGCKRRGRRSSDGE